MVDFIVFLGGILFLFGGWFCCLVGFVWVMVLFVSLSVLFGFSYLQNMPVLTEEQKEDFNCFEDLMTKEFIGQQLILVIDCMDTTEEGGR